jgi:hypothetical protein
LACPYGNRFYNPLPCCNLFKVNIIIISSQQNSTKAATRAARNAIEFNSIPCIKDIVPGGKENMLLRVQIAGMLYEYNLLHCYCMKLFNKRIYSSQLCSALYISIHR